MSSSFRWGMYGWGCFAAFFGYLFLVSEVLDEPGLASTVAHVLGAGIVGFGVYSAYRSMRSGRDVESSSAREARKDLTRLRAAGGIRHLVPPDIQLPLQVDARPKLVNDRARESPLPWLVGAGASVGLAWAMSDDLGWSFPLTLAGFVGFVAGIIGLGYTTNRRGRIVIEEQRVHSRSGFRTRALGRSALQDAVEVTLHVFVHRGPDQYITTVHVVGTDGRRAFSLSRDVFDEAGIAAVLGVLQLPLHRVPGNHDAVTVEAFVPGSTSLALRRPFVVGIAVAAVLLVVIFLGIAGVAWYSE